MSDISLKDGTLIINGVEIVGFGDSESAIDFPNIDTTVVRRGADGGMVSGSTGNRGGPLTLTLLQNSPAYYFLMALHNASVNGASITISGFYSHQVGGFTGTLEGGVITNAPGGPSLGNAAPPAKAFTIEFETITFDYSVANS